MLFTYDGIVVGRRDIGESNCFIDILTDEQGIIEATAHGVKKINSSLLGSCGLFSYATFCLNKTKQRYSVNSAKPKRSFHELGSDIEKLALGSYFAQAVKFCTPQEQAAEGSDSLDLRGCCNCGCGEHDEMFFLPDSGELICGDCFDREYSGRYFVLTREILGAMQNIVYARLDEAFRFSVSPQAAKLLGIVTENYFLARTERSFSALDYYKSIRME